MYTCKYLRVASFMDKNKTCKICGIHEGEGIDFHTHHIKPRAKGGSDSKENLIDICNDCHYSIHYPDHEDGELEALEQPYKDAIADNIFSGGWGILPKIIAHDPSISAFAKILYSDISSLCAQRGYCWASNAYFAKVFTVSERTVTRAMKEIEPFLIIKNKMSAKRTIWVHQVNGAPTKKRSPLPKQEKKKAAKKDTKTETVKYTDQDLFLAGVSALSDHL